MKILNPEYVKDKYNYNKAVESLQSEGLHFPHFDQTMQSIDEHIFTSSSNGKFVSKYLFCSIERNLNEETKNKVSKLIDILTSVLTRFGFRVYLSKSTRYGYNISTLVIDYGEKE